MTQSSLPIHPTARHPHTGQPLQAIWVTPAGRVCWPILGAAEGDGGGDGGGGGQGGGQGSDGAGGGQGSGGSGGAGSGQGRNATDASGSDLGFPRDTPVAEMAEKEQAAYWRDKARKHEGRVKDLFGDRDPAEVKKDLEAYAELKKAEQTPAEQAINDARDQGRAEGVTSERTKAATAIFRGALEANGVTGEDLDEIASNFNVAGYISDAGVDTTKIANFAKRFTPARGGQQQERRRDFGGGQRREGTPERGAAGKAMAEKRFGKKTTA